MSGVGIKRERFDEGGGHSGHSSLEKCQAGSGVHIKVATERDGDFKDTSLGSAAKKPRKSRFKDKDETQPGSSSSSYGAAIDSKNYYGSTHTNTNTKAKAIDDWGGGDAELEREAELKKENEDIEKEKEKANFGLSGALAADKKSGNVVNGIQLKWSEPLDASQPTQQWRLYSFKGEELVDTLHIHRQSAYLIGRDERVVDIHTAHASCSKQHAVIQFRSRKVEANTGGGASSMSVTQPYVMDLGSANKTYLNGDVIEDSRYYELREQDSLRFGASTREFILLNSNSSSKSKQ